MISDFLLAAAIELGAELFKTDFDVFEFLVAGFHVLFEVLVELRGESA